MLKKHVRILKNVLSAIITSLDGRATHAQNEQLKKLYESINEQLKEIFILPIIKEKSEKYQCDFYYVLLQENLYDSWLKQNNLYKYQIRPFDITLRDEDSAFNNYIQYIDNQLSYIQQKQKRQFTDVTNLPVLQNNMIIDIPEQEKILSKLFNEYLKDAYNSDEFIQSRYEFAKSGGRIFKEELQEKWIGSQWQEYINGLLKNLNEHSAFDLKHIKNTVLESFAAFCQKGEADIDKLEDYLIMNEVGDFRIAFSLWGIVFGFANMPKTLTDELFQSNDLDYITRIYKYIFKQLHFVELEGKLERTEFIKPIDQLKPKIPVTKKKEEINQPSKTKLDSQNIEEKLKLCKLKPEHRKRIIEIYENNPVINENFFAAIRKIKGVGKKTIDKIKEALGNKNNGSYSLPLSFENPKLKIRPQFYNDSNVWKNIESLIPKEFRKKVKREINWIQKVHKEGGYKKKSGEWIHLEDHSNKTVIEHFKNNAEKRIKNDELIIPLALLNNIVKKLRELYPENDDQ